MAFNNAEYQTKYIKENLRRFEVKVNRNTEKAMLEWLEGKDSVQAYIKDLIKADMLQSRREQATWYIVDDALKTKGQIFDEDTGTRNKEKALAKARSQWEAMSEADQKRRSDFYIALATANEDGGIDWNSIIETVDIMHV